MTVWDRPVRLLHWALALGVAAAWVTSEVFTRWHERIGYGVLVVVSMRVAWGFAGGRHARFRGFVVTPVAAFAYVKRLVRSEEPRYLGHNPLGGWMAVALLGCAGITAASGWLFTTDRFWGDDLVEGIHRAFAWTTLALIPLHVGGVIFTSIRHRENLVAAMWSGTKRAPTENDIV